jgi:Putative MetA-pathway of phenol degradation
LNTQNIKNIIAVVAVAWLSMATHVDAQEVAEAIQPDRPDVTNGTRIVPSGIAQLEFGGLFIRPVPTASSASSPFTLRVGLSDWLEVRIGADGLLIQDNGDIAVTGFGNVQLGAKVRLWAEPGGTPVLSILPTVNLPTANASRGLGSGDPDYTIAFLTGTDIYRRGHVDINYGVGAIGAGQGRSHFVQHLISASLSEAVTDRWNPYVELFWFSRSDIDGASETSLDTGVIYEFGSHFAIDGGVQFGVAGSSAGFGVFGGVSMIVGGEHALNGRQRKVKTAAAKPR